MREPFSDKHIADFLRRSYFAVDGLWFVKTEEQLGFDQAMALDEAVWTVMPKVQARKAKSLLGIEGGSVEDLAKAFQLKLSAEGYEFDAQISNDGAVLSITPCPWFEILKSSGRTQIAETIADRICAKEFSGWTDELAPGAEIEFDGRLCVEREKCKSCRIKFRNTVI